MSLDAIANEEKNKQVFLNFMKSEGYTEVNDKADSFQKNMPVFYKRVSEDEFLVFNIPYYGKVAGANFVTDFWRVKADFEEEFLKKRIADDNLKLILLGFQLEKDLELYKKKKAEISCKVFEYAS